MVDIFADYSYSAFDNKKLRLRSKLKSHIKYIGLIGVAGFIFLALAAVNLLFILAGIVFILFWWILLGSQPPGDVFAKQNNLSRLYMKTHDYYYFAYDKYKKATDTALTKDKAMPWELPVASGELGIVFLKNLDVLVWGRLSQDFPHLVIDATGNDRFLGNNIDNKKLPVQQVSLEGNFPEYFRVYMEKGQEVLSLQILSPDRMVSLIDNMPKFDLEIKDNYIKIYGVGVQQSSQAMRLFMKVLQSLHEDLKISRLNNVRVD